MEWEEEEWRCETEREIRVKQLCLAQAGTHRAQRRAPHLPTLEVLQTEIRPQTPSHHVNIPEVMSRTQEAGFRWERGNSAGESNQRAAPKSTASTKKASGHP